MEIHLYHCNNSAEWLTVMDYAAQGMFIFPAELSPHAQQNENSRYPQLEVISGGDEEGGRPVKIHCGAKVSANVLLSQSSYENAGTNFLKAPYTVDNFPHTTSATPSLFVPSSLVQ